MTCKCESCKSINQWKAALLTESSSPDAVAAFDEMLEIMLTAQYDVDWYRAIHSGTWPGGKKVLEGALAKYPAE